MKKYLVFCETCGECLGEERPNYAKEHLKLFPNHQSFLVKTIYDPLLLENPDIWFKDHIPRMKFAYQPKVNTINTTDKETEPVSRFCQLESTSID